MEILTLRILRMSAEYKNLIGKNDGQSRKKTKFLKLRNQKIFENQESQEKINT